MTVDTTEFRAITEQVADHERRLVAYSSALASAFEAADLPVPQDLRPGRHAKPRERHHLRVIRGGAA